MNVMLILSAGGFFIVSSFVSSFLEQSGRTHHAKTIDMIAYLVGATVVISSLATLITKVQSTFNVY